MNNNKIIRVNLFNLCYLCAFVFWIFFSQTSKAQDFTNIKDMKPFSIGGNIGASAIFYNASGIENRQSPFAYGFNADVAMSIYGFSLPFSFVWYNQQSQFNYPSFNRFGMSPKYKWITGHFGYRSMRLSEFTLNGHTFLGAGLELTPGKFRIAAMYGKFNENSDYDPYMADSIPRLTRLGWAAKVGYGTEQNFVDISLLRIGDDTKKYRPMENKNFPSPEEIIADSIPDSAVKIFPTPEQNLVIGLTTHLTIIPKLTFSFDGSISGYTKNVMDSIPVEVKGFGTSIVKKLLTINMTSAYYKALKTALQYKITDRIGVGVEYRLIDPNYKSLGAYYFNDDMELFAINANAGLLKNKLILRGSLGIQHDNLGKTKKFTSRRVVGTFAGTYNFNQNWGIDANYSNFSTNQRSGRSPIIDSLRLFQINHTISLMPRYTKTTTSLSHFVMLNVSRMQLDDKNKKTEAQSETKTTVVTPNYSVGILKSRTNLSVGLNYTTLENNMYAGKTYGGSLGAAQALFGDKLSINWTNSLMLNKFGGNDGNTFNSFLTTVFRPFQKHTFNFSLNFISNKYSGTENSSFNETRGEIRYAYSF